MPEAADHAPEGASQAEGDHQDEVDLDTVRERIGVLERVCGVRVVEATTVGSELLDCLLRGDRTAGDGLSARRPRS